MARLYHTLRDCRGQARSFGQMSGDGMVGLLLPAALGRLDGLRGAISATKVGGVGLRDGEKIGRSRGRQLLARQRPQPIPGSKPCSGRHRSGAAFSVPESMRYLIADRRSPARRHREIARSDTTPAQTPRQRRRDGASDRTVAALKSPPPTLTTRRRNPL
jgi:hypothetical protein